MDLKTKFNPEFSYLPISPTPPIFCFCFFGKAFILSFDIVVYVWFVCGFGW